MTDAEIDQRIIKSIQQGSRDAFAELYDRHHAWLMAVGYRILQNHRDTEDLLHDVFLEIWNKSASYKPSRGTLKSWLVVKMRSRALDRLRALNTVKKYIDDRAFPETKSTPGTNETSCVVDHIKARRILGKLSPAQRNVIELSYFRGFTCQEIANYCHMPLGTVKSGIQRAIKVLQREINSKKGPCTCQ